MNVSIRYLVPPRTDEYRVFESVFDILVSLTQKEVAEKFLQHRDTSDNSVSNLV